jgi:hypothetical protein
MVMAGQKASAPQRDAITQAFRESFETDIQNGFSLSFYLTMCPEHLVEEQPVIPPSAQVRRANDPKPWTYRYLPRIILLDPSETPAGENKAHQGGSHASPRPHQRRGHWATLRHPKFSRNADGSFRQVFVKPAWVGPREWIMQGNRYRVINQQGKALETVSREGM